MIAGHNSFGSARRHRLSGTLADRRRRTQSSRRCLARSGTAALPLRLCRFAAASFPSQQKLAQHVKVASQHTKTDITFITKLAAVPAAFQSVPSLQTIDRRLDSWMILPSPAKFHVGVLICSLYAGDRHARHGHDLRQLLLVLGRMEGLIERRVPNLPVQP